MRMVETRRVSRFAHTADPLQDAMQMRYGLVCIRHFRMIASGTQFPLAALPAQQAAYPYAPCCAAPCSHTSSWDFQSRFIR